MSVPNKYPRGIVNHDSHCRRCSLHCLPSCELQSRISKLEKENVSFKKEKEEWLAEHRRCILELSDVSIEKKQLEIALREAENENNCLKKNVESKSRTIHRFLNEQVKVIKTNDMKTMGKLVKTFHIVKNKIGECSVDQLSILQTLQNVQQTCNNYRVKEEEYEKKVKQLQDAHLNNRFLIHQQEELISKLKEDNEKEKKEQKKEKVNQEDQKFCKEKGDILLPPTPDSPGSWTTTGDTMSSENSCETLLSPTIDLSDSALETKSTLLLDIKSKSKHQEEVVSKSITKQNKPCKDLQSAFKESVNITELDSHDTVRNSVKNSATEKKCRNIKSSHETNNMEIDAIGHCGKNAIKKLFSTKLHEEEVRPAFKLDESKTGKSEIVSPKESNVKVSLPQNTNELSRKNISTSLEDINDNKMQKPSVKDSEVHKKIVLNNKKKHNSKEDPPVQTFVGIPKVNDLACESLSPTIKSLSDHEENDVSLANNSFELSVKCHPVKPVALVAGHDNNSDQISEDVDAKSVIGSEGWSPQYNLESNDFEPTLSKLAQFPGFLSPFGLSLREGSESRESNKYLVNNSNCILASDFNYNGLQHFHSFFVNPNQSKSIFSPVHSGNTQCETTVVCEKRIETVIGLEPDKNFLNAKHHSDPNYDTPNRTFFIPNSRTMECKPNDDIKNEFDTNTVGVGSFSQNDSAERNPHCKENHKFDNSKISNYDIVHEKKEEDLKTRKFDSYNKSSKMKNKKGSELLKKLNRNSIIQMKDSKGNNEKTSKRLAHEMRVGYFLEELKADRSELSEQLNNDNVLPLDLTLKKTINGYSSDTSKGEILCKEDKQSCITFPFNKQSNGFILHNQENKNHVKINNREEHTEIEKNSTSELPNNFPSVRSPSHSRSFKEVSETIKAKLSQTSSCPTLRSEAQISPLSVISQNVTTNIISKTVESLPFSPRREVKGKKISREVKALNISPLPDSLFYSPPSKHNDLSPQISLRSPTAMDRYGLRTSPKVHTNLLYSVQSKKKINCGSSTKSSKRFSKNKNLNVLTPLKKTKRPISTPPLHTKNVSSRQKSTNCNLGTPTPLRSPESMKHYDMRLQLSASSRNNCSIASCLGVKSTNKKRNSKGATQSPVEKPLKVKRSTILPNKANSLAEILSEIKIQSSKDDSEPLDNKLILTPQERMNALIDQKLLIEPCEINVSYKDTNGFSMAENKGKVVPVIHISPLENEANITGNIGVNLKKDSSTNALKMLDETAKSNSVLESPAAPHLSRTLYRSYLPTIKHTLTNDPEIANDTLSESLLATVTKMNIDESREAENSFVVTNQQTTNNSQKDLQFPDSSMEYLSKTSSNKIEMLPVDKMETTISEEELFMDCDMTSKCISYLNTSVDGRKRKSVNESLDEDESESKKPLTKEFFVILSTFKRFHLNAKKLTSLEKFKHSSKKSRKISRGRASRNTNEVHKDSPKHSIDFRMDLGVDSLKKVVHKSSNTVEGFGESCLASKANSKQVKMILQQDHTNEIKVIDHIEPEPKIDQHHNIIKPRAICTTECLSEKHKILNPSPSSLNEKDGEEEHYLVIDIGDEDIISLPETDNNSYITAEQTVACASEPTPKITPEKITHISNKSKLCQKTLETQVSHSKRLDIGNMEICNVNAETSNCLNSSYYVPCFQSMPQAMCKYEEKLVKTNTDFSYPENRVLPSSMKSVTSSEALKIVSKIPVKTDVYLPNFYTEHKDSIKEQPDTTSQEQICPKKEQIPNKNLPSNNVFKLMPLHELIPKGVKIKVTENVLQTVIKKHKDDLPHYKERNISKKITNRNTVSVELSQRVVKIISPLLCEGMKNLTDIVKVVDELKQFEIRVIVKALMLRLYQIASDAELHKPEAVWMFNWDVPQLPNKKSPIVHPNIQSVLILLVFVIDHLTKEKSEEEKKQLVEEELHFIELAFLGGILEFTDSLPLFWLNLGFMYTLLARKFNQLVRVRQLMYDMLYCFTKRALTVAYAMIRVWPFILPVRPIESYMNDPISLCIILQLTTANVQARFSYRAVKLFMISELQDFMRRKYKFLANTINPDQIFDLCLERLGQFGVHEAVVLLAKRQSQDWFKKRPLEELMNVVKGWWKGNKECTDIRAVAAINALCSSLRAYPFLKIQEEISDLFKLFKEILSDENTPSWMQEVVVLNVCCLSRLNTVYCLEVIVTWRPTEISQEVLDRILVDIIGKRPPHWWNGNRIGRFYLSQSRPLSVTS